MATLAVTGCSFSDYTMVDKVYGEFAAEILNYDYLHLARGSSSNHRGVLVATKAILEKKLVKDDILVFQYTDPHRKVLASVEPDPDIYNAAQGNSHYERWDTQYGYGWTTDYKFDSYTWQGGDYVGKLNAQLHQTLQNTSINNIFETEQMALHQALLEAMCKVHGIHFVPLISRYIEFVGGAPLDQNDIVGSFRQRLGKDVATRCIHERDIVQGGDPDNPSPNDLGYYTYTDHSGKTHTSKEYDISHLSLVGHETLGTYLAKHLKSHKLTVQ